MVNKLFTAGRHNAGPVALPELFRPQRLDFQLCVPRLFYMASRLVWVVSATISEFLREIWCCVIDGRPMIAIGTAAALSRSVPLWKSCGGFPIMFTYWLMKVPKISIKNEKTHFSEVESLRIGTVISHLSGTLLSDNFLRQQSIFH